MREPDIQSAQTKSVPLGRINSQDDTYRISTRTSVDDLLVSIAHEGLLNPPLVIQQPSDFRIVSGFRRIAAFNKLGLQGITIRILKPDLSSLQCLRLAIADNSFQRPLNLIEASRSLQKLSAFFNTGQALSESAATLGLPSNPSVIKKIKNLCRLPESIQRAIIADTISLSMAGELEKMPTNFAIDLARLFNEFKLSLNKQREILTLIKEISRRDSIPEQAVLEDRHLQDIILDQDLDRGQKVRELRAYLRQRRFPQIVNTEANFENQRKRLNLGQDIKFIPPKGFEGTTYTLNMSFSSITQLKTLHSKLDQILKHPGLKKIIERKDS